jgi:PAS domain S-box-containing protein
LIDILVPYFKTGLENNEFCMWVTSQPLEVEEAKEALRKAVHDVDIYLEKGQLEIIPYYYWYVKDGTFDSDRVLNGWIEKLKKALANGYDGLRLTGNTFWLEKEDWNDFVDYEKDVDRVISNYQMMALCTYNLDRCNATEIIDVVVNHQFALIKKQGKWGRIESSKHKITEEKRLNLQYIIESANDAIITLSLDGIITSWNEGAKHTYGYSSKEILGKSVSILEPNNLKNETKTLIEKVKLGEKIRHHVTSRLRKDCKLIYVSIALSPVFDASGERVAISAIAREITQKIEAKKSLVRAEKTRKKEIHHRIKNNLQVISSLLDLQAEKFKNKEWIKNSEILEAFSESKNRVISMALIHEELHKDDEFEMLDFSIYIRELAENLFQTYRIDGKNIHLHMDMEENIFLDMDTAIPLGIIVNELVSNSLKHAFIEEDRGRIYINLRREKNGELINSREESKYEDCKSTSFILTVSDDGVGIPESFDLENPNSLGMQLVTTLVDQLAGEFALKRNNGTEFTIRFTYIKNK